jgi:hypothetical protein
MSVWQLGRAWLAGVYVTITNLLSFVVVGLLHWH